MKIIVGHVALQDAAPLMLEKFAKYKDKLSCKEFFASRVLHPTMKTRQLGDEERQKGTDFITDLLSMIGSTRLAEAKRAEGGTSESARYRYLQNQTVDLISKQLLKCLDFVEFH